MHTNYYTIVKLWKSFKIIIVAPTCFGLLKPSSASSQPVLRQSYNVYSGYIYRYMKLSVLWLNICSVRFAQCTIHTHDFNIFHFFKHMRFWWTSERCRFGDLNWLLYTLTYLNSGTWCFTTNDNAKFILKTTHHVLFN